MNDMNLAAHSPVLLRESIQALALKPGQIVVDATYGRGGHAREIFKKITPAGKLPGGKLVLLDRDLSAIQHARENWRDCPNVEIIHCEFSELAVILKHRDLHGTVDAVLFDFGVSSPQLDEPTRGFSFKSDGPLDMRMNRDQEVDASMWIRRVSVQELIRVLKTYGEERFAKRIAHAIKNALTEDQDHGEFARRAKRGCSGVQGEFPRTGKRKTGDSTSAIGAPELSTAALARLVSAAIPFSEKHKHPATRTFQAIRIAVNNELGEIEKVLPQALDCLVAGGRLVMISFHSLEDRLVKRFIRDQAKGDPYPVDMPVTADMLSPRLCAMGKAIRASGAEIEANPRARSAVMRVATKCQNSHHSEKRGN